MAQEFYIDENGNKIPISGTVTSADMLPMSASDDTKVSEAIEAVDAKVDNIIDVDFFSATIGGNSISFWFRRTGNIVAVTIGGARTAYPTSWTNIGTVSANFRPTNTQYFTILTTEGRILRFSIANNGNVFVYTDNSNPMYNEGTGVYTFT